MGGRDRALRRRRSGGVGLAAAVLALTALGAACSSVVKEPEVRLDNIGIGRKASNEQTNRAYLNTLLLGLYQHSTTVWIRR